MASFAQTVQDLWLAVTGRQTSVPISPRVILHDPDAQRPHDLDDPFFDPEVRSRMADVIAANAKKQK